MHKKAPRAANSLAVASHLSATFWSSKPCFTNSSIDSVILMSSGFVMTIGTALSTKLTKPASLNIRRRERPANGFAILFRTTAVLNVLFGDLGDQF